MLKTLDSLAAGDWVVTESLISSRHIGTPWLVSSVVKSRVYLERWRLDPVTQVRELTDQKYVAARSVQYVFTDQASAEAASGFARANSMDYERKLSALQAENLALFKAYIAGLPRVAPGSPIAAN